MAWLKQNGVYVGLPTCIELFDDLAHDFVTSENKQSAIISQAENEVSKIENETKRVSGLRKIWRTRASRMI